MRTPDEKQFFLDNGCLHVTGVLNGLHLGRIQREFDRVWEREKPLLDTHKQALN